MIVKSLSRRSNSPQLVRYILRYIMQKEGGRTKARERKPIVYRADPGAKYQKDEYRRLFKTIAIRYKEKDLENVMKELSDGKFMALIRQYSPDLDFKTFSERYFKTEDIKEVKEQPFIIKHNIRANDIDGFIREFKENEGNRLNHRVNEVKIYHSILSWSNLDSHKITDEMLRDMANKYIELRGKNNLYLGSKHTDRDHLHIHLCVSASDINGKASRMSKEQFQDLKIKLQEYQKEKYPELIHSLPEHTKERAQKYDRDDFKNKKHAERGSVKQSLYQCIETLKANSTKELFQGLEPAGFAPYYRAGRLAGLQHEDGLKFRFSRLPIDLDKLIEKDIQLEKEAEELASIQRIRAGKKYDLTKEIKTDQDILEARDEVQRLMAEIESIRGSGRNRVVFDKEKDMADDDKDQEQPDCEIDEDEHEREPDRVEEDNEDEQEEEEDTDCGDDDATEP